MNNNFSLNMNKSRVGHILNDKGVASAIVILAQRILRKAYFDFYGKSVRSLSEIETDLVLIGCNELKSAIGTDFDKMNSDEINYLENVIVYIAMQQCDNLNESEEVKELISNNITKKGIPELKEYLH